MFCSDPLSSNAYATEEILRALSLGGLALFFLTPWVALAVVVLLAVVVVSYRQTCYAYPNGGGAYAVSRAEPRAQRLAGGGERAAGRLRADRGGVGGRGVDTITSAFLALRPHAVIIAVRGAAGADEPARSQGVRDGLRDPDLRLHRGRLRDDRLGRSGCSPGTRRLPSRPRSASARRTRPAGLAVLLWRCGRSPRAAPR